MGRRKRDNGAMAARGGVRVQPVFDPDLPPRVRARLRGNPSSLLREASSERPWAGYRRRLLVGGVAVAAAHVAWLLGQGWLLMEATGWYFVGLLALAAVTAAGGIAAIRVTPHTALPSRLRRGRGRKWWVLLCLSVLPVTFAGWFFSQTWTWLFFVTWHGPWLGYAAVSLWVAFGWSRNERLAAAHAHRYLVPADFDERGSELLADVQKTINTLWAAGKLMGGSFDAEQPLGVLRAEEWRIASALYRYQQLRAEHGKESAEAASDRVRTLLARQNERQEAAYEQLSEQVGPIREYGAAVGEALRAHTEWEQIERAEDREGRIDELSARVSSEEGVSVGLLRDEALSARAAKEARDELIDQALAAGRLLGPESRGRG